MIAELLAGFFLVSSCAGWVLAWHLSRQRDRLQDVIAHYIREVNKANRVIPALTEHILEMQEALDHDGEAWKHGNN